MATNRAFANTLSSFDATLLTGAFQVCEPGLSHPCFLLKIVNSSGVNVIISYDGSYGHDVVKAYSFFASSQLHEIVFPVQACNKPRGHINLFAKGTPVYVAKETNAGKSGDIYVISYYQPIIG